MRIAFFCSTPYQIINAINIKEKLYQSDIADILVLKHFHQFDLTVERLKDIGVFDCVYGIDDGDFDYRYVLPSIKRYPLKIKDFIWCEKVIEPYINTDHVYDAVFYTFPNMLIEFFCYYSITKNKYVKFYMFEDGFSSYSDDLLAISNAKSLFLKVMGRKQFLDVNHELFLYAPKLFCKSRKKKEYTVKQLPLLNGDDRDLCKIYNKLFELEAVNRIKERVLFFEQPYEDESVNHHIRKTLDMIMNKVNKNDLCIKLHPRGKKELYQGLILYPFSSVPMEVLYQNMEDLSDRVLISSVSTACITPKLVFGKEPRLLLLYKYLKLEEQGIITPSLVQFIEKVIDTYIDKTKIMIPEKESELIKCIELIGEIE